MFSVKFKTQAMFNRNNGFFCCSQLRKMKLPEMVEINLRNSLFHQISNGNLSLPVNHGKSPKYINRLGLNPIG